MQRVTLASSGNQPTLIVFDIQAADRLAIADLTRKQGLPVFPAVPVVTMNLEKVNGEDIVQLKNEKAGNKPSPSLIAHEYRVTYRDSLTSTERIVDGKWVGHSSINDTVPVSFEDRFARRNHLHVGDKLLFNVQGLPVNAVVKSIRSVNYNRIQTNFLVVFPAGVLEQAPQFYVMLTHVANSKVSAKYQQTVVGAYPSVSVVDLALILSVVDDLLNKIGYIIRFMASFSIITGIIVLIASVRISKYQRIKESVLLRTLGASRRQVLVITGLEYMFLGTLAAATGILISLAASWALAKFTFDTNFTPSPWPVMALFLLISLLTVVIGLLNSRGVLEKPPLEVLRNDV